MWLGLLLRRAKVSTSWIRSLSRKVGNENVQCDDVESQREQHLNVDFKLQSWTMECFDIVVITVVQAFVTSEISRASISSYP